MTKKQTKLSFHYSRIFHFLVLGLPGAPLGGQQIVWPQKALYRAQNGQTWITKPFWVRLIGYKHPYQARKLSADDCPPTWSGLNMQKCVHFWNTFCIVFWVVSIPPHCPLSTVHCHTVTLSTVLFRLSTVQGVLYNWYIFIQYFGLNCDVCKCNRITDVHYILRYVSRFTPDLSNLHR